MKYVPVAQTALLNTKDKLKAGVPSSGIFLLPIYERSLKDLSCSVIASYDPRVTSPVDSPVVCSQGVTDAS